MIEADDMQTNETNLICDYSSLQANLYLLATDFEGLKTYLAGYTDEGIYSECLEGVRDSMNDFPLVIRSGKLPLSVIAQIVDFYYLMERLARLPSTGNVEAFRNGSDWQKAKELARLAADALDRIS